MRKDGHADIVRMIIATAVAATGLFALLLVNHAPWNKPNVRNETMIQYGSAAAAAAAIGATVTPTEQKPEVKPVATGAKPGQHAIPDQRKT
jgi:hypothetical protein